MKTAACLLLCMVAGSPLLLHAANADTPPGPASDELAKMREAAPGKATAAPAQPRKVLVCSLVTADYVHSAIPYGEFT